MAAKSDLQFAIKLVLIIALVVIFTSFVMPASEITGDATQLTVIKSQRVPDPQLKIISFQNRPVTPVSKGTVTFILVVKNIGYNSPATTVDFSVNGNVIKTMPLNALEQNAAETIKITWTVPAKGAYTAVASVKPVLNDNPIDNTDRITFRVV